MNLVGKKAPLFKAPAVINGNTIVEDFSLTSYDNKQAVLLFFYPKDFTFICPTELVKLQEKQSEFIKRNVALVAISTDSVESHWTWSQIAPSQGGINGVTFPIVADLSKTISSNYGVLAGSWYHDDDEMLHFLGDPVAYRSTFLIDKSGIIRYAQINDLPMGRNINEILRTIDMLDHVENNGEVCPVDWQKGNKGMDPSPKGLLAYLGNQIIQEDQTSQGNSCCQQKVYEDPLVGKYQLTCTREKGECSCIACICDSQCKSCGNNPCCCKKTENCCSSTNSSLKSECCGKPGCSCNQ